MTVTDAIKTCFSRYADFNGRASREEYWYFFLFTMLTNLALNMVNSTAGVLFSLVTLVPSVAVAARRLHDTNRSGWWQLLSLVPLIGWIALLVFLVQQAREPNQFGSGSDALVS